MPGFLIDTNLWIAAAFEGHDHHELANDFFSQATPDAPACFCRATEQSCLRLLTTPALHRRYDCAPVSNRDALKILSDCHAHSNVRMIDAEPAGTRDLWHEFADLDSASPKVWMDAYLAAFAVCGKLTLVALDGDFAAHRDQGLDLRLLLRA